MILFLVSDFFSEDLIPHFNISAMWAKGIQAFFLEWKRHHMFELMYYQKQKDLSASYGKVNSLGIMSQLTVQFFCPRIETEPGGSLELGASETCPEILLHYSLV